MCQQVSVERAMRFDIDYQRVAMSRRGVVRVDAQVLLHDDLGANDPCLILSHEM